MKWGSLASGGNEQQPGNSYIDPAYQSGTGWLPEFYRRYRLLNHPTTRLDYFGHAVGGSRFSDLSSFVRAGNWLATLSDGAFAAMAAEWQKYSSYLQNTGRRPLPIMVLSGLGISSSDNTPGSNVEANAFQNDMTNLIAGLRAKVFGSCKLALLRCCVNIYNTYQTTVRAAQQAIVDADPGRMDMLNGDFVQTNAATSYHPTAAGMNTIGYLTYHSFANLWHPAKEITGFRNGNQTTQWVRAGEIANAPVAGPFSSIVDYANVDTAPNTRVYRTYAQGTAANQPTLTTVNGARCAVFDGTNDTVQNALPFAYAQSGGVSFFFAVQAPAQADANRTIYGEGGSGTPFYLIRGNNSGDLTFLYRDDSGTLVTVVTLQSGAYNNVMNALDVHDTKTTITGVVNGSAGSAQAYTRGTTTLTAANIGSNNVGQWFNVTALATMWTTAAVSDATYNANALAFRRREYGTP